MAATFKGKVVIVTGSSQGIGKATALFLGSLGARVVIHGRNEQKLHGVANEMAARKIECLQVISDIATDAGCKAIIEQTISHFGRIDVLINNAGVASHGLIEETSVENWEHVLNINTHGTINTTFHALPYLKKVNGSVIIISSMAAKVGVPGHSAYSVSKMALTAYAKALQIELRNQLHCGLVYVGFTENETQKQILQPDGTYKVLKQRKGLKLASREDVAKAIAYTIVKRKKQITLTFLGKLQHLLLKIAPGVVYFTLRRSFKDYDGMYS